MNGTADSDRNGLTGSADLWRNSRIGLLGGSFNPAHAGHLHVSLEALKRLRLDHVWWLVSPQNPLKPVQDMAPLAERLTAAQAVARHPRIHVTDIERQLGTRYTVETLSALRFHLPGARLVWLMGADNMASFSEWRNWQGIARTVPIAIFDRPGYSVSALNGIFARRFAGSRLRGAEADQLACKTPPAWVFVSCPRHPESATRIRGGTDQR